MSKIFLVTALLAAIASTSLHAANNEDFQSWTQVVAQGPMGKPLRGYLELQPRVANHLSSLDRFLIRPALWLVASPHWQLWLGGLISPKTSPVTPLEYNLWEQAVYATTPDRLTGIFRVRMEERFLSNVDLLSTLRAMIRTQYDLHGDGSLWLVGWNELYWNLNTVSSANRAGFDQNQLFVGLNFPLSQNLRAEAGYLNDLINRPGNENRINDVAMLSIFYNIP